MMDLLKKQTFEVILLVAGLGFVLISTCDVQLQPTAVTLRSSVRWVPLVIGVPLVFSAIFLWAASHLLLPWPLFSPVRSEGSSYVVDAGRCSIGVNFGCIEDTAVAANGAVVLPANEYFDDECIADQRSALGAYVARHFPDLRSDLQAVIRQRLANHTTTDVEKETGQFEPSHGIGHSVYLDRPLASVHRMIVVSVTTKRAGQRLRGSLASIVSALDQICCTARDARLEAVCLPVIGSGHGGVPARAALFVMLLSLVSQARSPTGHHVRSARVVVFQRDMRAKPQIPRRQVRRILHDAFMMGSKD